MYRDEAKKNEGCSSCGQGACAQNHCGLCCGGSCGKELFLTQMELQLLLRFGELPFLPVVRAYETGELLLPEGEQRFVGALQGLQRKGLVTVDENVRLSNYRYTGYADGFACGSAALTAMGQRVVELIEIQGTVES